MDSRKVLLVHHFPLDSITGVTVMIRELIERMPRLAPELAVAYRHYDEADSADAMRRSLEERDGDARCVVGVNLQIEVKWEWSVALAQWCRSRAIPLYNQVQDYWPEHEAALRRLTDTLGVHSVASSPFVAQQLARDRFDCGLLPMGAQLLSGTPPAQLFHPRKIASIGRIVRRKRFPDVVRGFRLAGLGDRAELHLTLLRSHVFGADRDDDQISRVEAELTEARRAGCAVVVRTTPSIPPDFTPFAAYVCASDYEGFSMPPYEAAYSGCPPIVSDIPPHRRMAEALFGDRAGDYLFPVSSPQALAARLKDEIETGRRRRFLLDRFAEVRRVIEEDFSLHHTARKFVELCRQANGAAS